MPTKATSSSKPGEASPTVALLSERQPLVSLTNIGVFRSGRWLVDEVSLSIAPGEIVTIIGPNGSGKSTVTKVLLGLIKPDRGQIHLKPDLKIGYVPQKLTVDWTLPLTVARLMTLTGRHRRSVVVEALEHVGVGHLYNAAIQALSGGEFQRVLLARALINKPDLLVLDEPVQGVDFNGQIELYRLISQTRDSLGCGVLLISHDLHIVMAQTDTVVCLNGHVCCHGTPQTVSASPAFRSLFGPRAAETLAIYQHHHDHTHAQDGTVIPTSSNTRSERPESDTA